MFYSKLSYSILSLFSSILVCLSQSILKHILIYICFSSSSGRGRSIDDQVLELALMTNYSQSTFMWTVASSLSVFAQIQYCLGWSSNKRSSKIGKMCLLCGNFEFSLKFMCQCVDVNYISRISLCRVFSHRHSRIFRKPRRERYRKLSPRITRCRLCECH